MSVIHDQIRALCARAEAKALTTFARKRDAEMTRHEKRLADLQRARDAEIRKTQAALRAVEGEPDPETQYEVIDPDEAIKPPGGYADPPPDEIPAALREPYRPRVGEAGA